MKTFKTFVGFCTILIFVGLTYTGQAKNNCATEPNAIPAISKPALVLQDSGLLNRAQLSGIEAIPPSAATKPAACARSTKPAQESTSVVPQASKRDESFAITLKLADRKSEYAVGDTISFVFESNRDCTVTLIAIGTSGRVEQIFPNAWHPYNKVKKGESFRIPATDSPMRFTVTGPPGTECVKAIATVQPCGPLSKAPESLGCESCKSRCFERPSAHSPRTTAREESGTWKETSLTFKVVQPRKQSCCGLGAPAQETPK